MVWERRVTRLRAIVLRRYPSSAIAASTLSRVALLTLGCLLITRDTVWCDTPARPATSSSRGNRALLLVMGLFSVTRRGTTNSPRVQGITPANNPYPQQNL